MKTATLIVKSIGFGVLVGGLVGGLMPTVSILVLLFFDFFTHSYSISHLYKSLSQSFGIMLYGAFLAAPFGILIGGSVALIVSLVFIIFIPRVNGENYRKFIFLFESISSILTGFIVFEVMNIVQEGWGSSDNVLVNPYSVIGGLLALGSTLTLFPRMENWYKQQETHQ